MTIQTYKYKSKIATAISFIALFILYIGKDGLKEIIPVEYTWMIPLIIFIATYATTQGTENKRVEVAEQMVYEKLGSIYPTEDVDPANDYEIAGDENDI